MKINIPEKVNYIIKTLEANGHEAFVVGGCVRDSLLGHTPNDWDVCTSAGPEETKLCFSAEGSTPYKIKIIDMGIKHGTVSLILDDTPFEVTTYRIDGEYKDNRRPSQVTYVHNVKEDLQRRDFTINSMAYNEKSGVVDYFHGREDLEKGIIRCVGKPKQRFFEDGLRILRALRFASVYDFIIEEQTKKAIFNCKHLLKNISAERIQVELEKLLCGKGVKDILLEYVDVFAVFLPEIKRMSGFEQKTLYHHLDVWGHTAATVAHIPPDPYLRLTMLLHDIGKPLCFTQDETGRGHFYGHNRISADIAKRILDRLNYDNETKNVVVSLVKYHDDPIIPERKPVKRWLNKVGEEQLRRLLLVKEADAYGKPPEFLSDRMKSLDLIKQRIDEILAEKMCFSLKDLDINGRDLMALGFPESAELGKELNKLLDRVIDEQIPNHRRELILTAKADLKKLQKRKLI